MKDRYAIDEQFPILMLEWTTETELLPLHWHDCLEIGLCRGGQGRFYFADKAFDAHAGDLFVINNLERHMTVGDPADPNRYLFVKFDTSFFDEKAQELLLPFVYDPKRFVNRIGGESAIAAEVGSLVERMWQEYNGRKFAYRSILESLLHQVCGLLSRHYEEQLQGRNAAELISAYRKVKPALDYIKANYTEPITLEDVARRLSLSYSRTYHLFKEVVGKGFKDYLNQLRIAKVKELLATTDLPITDIYLQCGFQSHTPFYKAFRRTVGMAPQEYRGRSSLPLAVIDM